MKCNNPFEKHRILNDEDYKRIQPMGFLYLFQFLVVTYFVMVIYFGYISKNGEFESVIEYMKKYEFFRNRYEDSELAMPGSALIYFLSMFFGIPITMLFSLMFALLFICKTRNFKAKQIKSDTIYLSLLMIVIACVFFHFSFFARIDFFNPLKKSDAMYIGVGQIIFSFIFALFFSLSISNFMILIFVLIRQKWKWRDGE